MGSDGKPDWAKDYKPREVFCHYERDWVLLGRNRKTCPRCGASLSMKGSHEQRYGPPTLEEVRQRRNARSPGI